jgi:hypothetical protein
MPLMGYYPKLQHRGNSTSRRRNRQDAKNAKNHAKKIKAGEYKEDQDTCIVPWSFYLETPS